MSDIKKFTQIIKEENTTKMQGNWKEVFVNQASSGKFWQNLFRSEFERHMFLDRSDAITICKKAQSEVYNDIIHMLKGRVDDYIIEEIRLKLRKMWEEDDSGLGLPKHS